MPGRVSMTGTARGAATTAVVVVSLLLASCATVATTGPAYRHEIVLTAQAGRSAVQTAELVARAVQRDQAPRRYASRALSDAEYGLQSAAITFGGLQPPGEAERALRRQLMAALDEAQTVVAELRIATRRDELADVARLARPLPGLAARFAALERAGSP